MAERQALKEEQDRIKRAQAYLGASAGQKEEFNQMQLLSAQERKIKTIQDQNHKDQVANIEVKEKNIKNRQKMLKTARVAKAQDMAEKEELVRHERREATRKIKDEVLLKKTQAATSRAQAEKTAKVRSDFNPYAESMRNESVALGRTHMLKLSAMRTLD